MKKYFVTCYSPPSALKIKKNDNVKVEGSLNNETARIRAKRITKED